MRLLLGFALVVCGIGAAAGQADTGTRVMADVAYGPSPAQRLDIYVPSGAKAAPVIVMVHGGAWRIGDKGRGAGEAKVEHFLSRDYILVSINYRMLPEADPRLQAEDVARALAFVEAHAARFGGDPRRVVAMGHSAGAHLVALLAAAPDVATRAGGHPAMATVALDSAAYDVAAIMTQPHLRLYDRAFGSDPVAWDRVSPMARLTRAPAPMLLVCSSRRAESCPQAEAFADRVTRVGGRAEVLPVAMNHMDINRRLGLDGDYTRAVDRFLVALGLP